MQERKGINLSYTAPHSTFHYVPPFDYVADIPASPYQCIRDEPSVTFPEEPLSTRYGGFLLCGKPFEFLDPFEEFLCHGICIVTLGPVTAEFVTEVDIFYAAPWKGYG